jgi:tetratricopeptide (TPR) repeat protein
MATTLLGHTHATGHRLARTVRFVLRVMVGSLGLQSQIGAHDIQTSLQKASAQVAQSHLERGEALSATRDYPAAIAAYSTAIQLKPDFAEAYNDRGFAYYLSGNAERAIADFTRAIELRPNYPQAYNSRGVVYMAHGYGSSRAVADFDRAIALKRDFRYAYINRANARLIRHPALALSDFHQAGMHPERLLIGAGAVLLAIGCVVAKRRHSRRTHQRG